MPELPEVETVVRSIRPHLIDKKFKCLTVLWNKSLTAYSEEGASQLLTGKRIEGVNRKGKYIILHLNNGFMTIHLRMTGKLEYHRFLESDPDHLRVKFQFMDNSHLIFKDIRKFGRIEIRPDLNHLAKKLGREPKECTVKYLQSNIKSRTRGIKSALLDQSIIAGLGNIYTDEILWMTKIHPETPAGTLKPRHLKPLIHNMNHTLEKAIRGMGTTILNFSFESGQKGQYGNQLKIFGKQDQPCPRCVTLIKKIRVAQRGTYFCPRCQKKR